MRRPPWARMTLAALVFLASGTWAPTARAGPARYDKDTKSFRFAYTFANLPGGLGSVVGQVTKPSADQEAKVKGLVSRVSAVMAQVTDGRAKIGELIYVDDIKNADLVISLVGAPASPGWANMRAIEGKPGQIVLYFQSLDGKLTQDVVNTAAHEICHYVFGLADEYTASNFPGGCPRGTGPGCLMDNYNAGARGFLGRLCTNADHNSQATQRPGCKEIVDKFFNDHGLTGGEAVGSVAATTNAANETSKIEVPDRRASLVAQVIAKVRAQHLENLDAGRLGSSSLSTFARTTFRNLLERFNRDNPNKVIMGGDESKLLRMIVDAGQVVPIEKPAAVDPKVFDQLKTKAEQLGRQHRDVKTESSRRSKILLGLRSFVRELLKLNVIDMLGLAPTEKRELTNSVDQVVEQLAREAARDPSSQSLDRLVAVGNRTAQLDLIIADGIIRLLDNQGEPGTRQRFELLDQVRGDLLTDFGISGRDSTQFGFRRTRIITPDSPAGPDLYVLTQGGVFPYATIRNRSVLDFSRLVDRGKIELVTPGAGQANDIRPVASRVSLPFASMKPEDPNERESAQVDTFQEIANVVDQLERHRLENIAILVPPGGLLGAVGEQVPLIRDRIKRLGSGPDVRLDVILVGAESLATPIRDAVVDSQGSVLTVTDVDEIGAIAQRLKNEQTSGSWVIIPQQGNFSIDQGSPFGPTPDQQRATEIRQKADKIVSLSKKEATATTKTKAPIAVASPRTPTTIATTKTKAPIAVTPTDIPKTFRDILEDRGSGGSMNLELQGAIASFWQHDLNNAESVLVLLPNEVQRALEDLKVPIAQSVGDEQIPNAVKERARLAIGEIDALIRAISIPGEKDVFEPNNLWSLSAKIAGASSDDPKLKSLPDGYHNQLLQRIGRAKDQLARCRALLREAMDIPGSDDASRALYDLASFIRGVQGDEKEAIEASLTARMNGESKSKLIATPTPNATLQHLSWLTPGLRRVEEIIRIHEKILEASYLRSGDELPIFKRIHRDRAEEMRLNLERASIEATTKSTVAANLRTRPGEYRLSRFYAEGNARLELILGLSRELPFSADGTRKHPRLRLVSDLGVEVADSSKVREDQATSTPSLLVWRVATPPLSPGWYTPVVTFEPEVMEDLKTLDTNFTFSVGSDRPNVQLITGLAQGADSPSSGTLLASEGWAVVEVQVSAGSSVLGARIQGFYQKIARGNEPIDPQMVDFRDDGADAIGNPPEDLANFDKAHHDRDANDGIYTAFIPLTGIQKDTEFRVFVLADTTDGNARYIGLDNPNRDDERTKGDRPPKDLTSKIAQLTSTEEAEGRALKFQRATSVHFQVKD